MPDQPVPSLAAGPYAAARIARRALPRKAEPRQGAFSGLKIPADFSPVDFMA